MKSNEYFDIDFLDLIGNIETNFSYFIELFNQYFVIKSQHYHLF